MNTSLVLVGMNVRPLAQSAVAAGFDVVALDAFGLLYASSEKLRSESRHPAAWHRTSEMFFRGDSANSVWKHLGGVGG